MGYNGEYMYWGIEGTKGAGDPSSDQNIPFNPFEEQEPQKPRYVDEELRTFDKRTPHMKYSTELAPGEGPMNNVFKDPFLMLAFFPHKVVGGTWGTGTGEITADFTDVDDVDTVWFQYRMKDLLSTNHMNRLLKKGLPMKYAWQIDPGKLLKEMPEFKFTNWADNTQAPSISNDFHDQSWGSGVGGWANWDNAGYCSDGRVSVTDMVLKWGGAELTGLKIKTMNFGFEVGSDTEQIYSSLSHEYDYFQPQNLSLELTGFLNDLSLVEEYEKIFCDRSSQTLQLYQDATTNFEKYLQCTNVDVSPESSVVPIPESGKNAEVTVIMKGGEAFALSFSGKYLNRVDPSAFITNSP